MARPPRQDLPKRDGDIAAAENLERHVEFRVQTQARTPLRRPDFSDCFGDFEVGENEGCAVAGDGGRRHGVCGGEFGEDSE